MEDLGNLLQDDPAAWSILEGTCNRFEAAWKSGRHPDISDYVRDASVAQSPELRRRLITELVMIDLEYRWRRAAEGRCSQDSPGGPVSPPLRLADYMARYPEFGPLEDLSDELIAEEYRARQLWGDRPTHEQYLQEYRLNHPQLTEALAETEHEITTRRDTAAISNASSVPSNAASPLASLSADDTRKKPEDLHCGDFPKPGLVVGNYVVLERIGQGGMGQVYKAQHRKMKRLVALKILPSSAMKSPDAVKRFQREVEAAAKLSHPNIVTAYDADESHGVHFLVMEYVEGRDLAAWVRAYGPLAVEVAADCILQAARGLEYAHSQGLFHRDVKPSNLLRDSNGVVKVLDMGLVRMDQTVGSKEAADDQSLSRSGQVVGTLALHGAGTGVGRSSGGSPGRRLWPGMHTVLPAHGPDAVPRRHDRQEDPGASGSSDPVGVCCPPGRPAGSGRPLPANAGQTPR
jgi:hypothetical protein